MKKKSLYHGHRYPAAIISFAVRWYFRFNLSLRDIEELLLERGVSATYESVRRWCDKFGAAFARYAKAVQRKPGSTWHLDEMFVSLCGESYLLWRAVDEHGTGTFQLKSHVQPSSIATSMPAVFHGAML